jgi:hypothetical protein
MTIQKFTSNDFERAYRKAFWRKVTAWLTREPNTLLPFYDVRDRMPIKGQHYLGLQQIPIERIVGSLGRYKDFDRAFLPRQSHTRNRWVNIDRAYYEQVNLPPVELFKMGEIYFVKDGNHRVSVAREWEQEFIDAYVTEIMIPVPLTLDMGANDLELQKELAVFFEQTKLNEFDPNITIESKIPGQYTTLIEHISFHRWILGEQRQEDVSFQTAAISWYSNVYQPLIAVVVAQDVQSEFPKLSLTDLYLWLVKYLWHLSVAYREEGGEEGITNEGAEERAVAKLIEEVPRRKVVRLINALKDENWVERFILQQERYTFIQKTHMLEYRPDAKIEMTAIGQYDVLEKHISVHRWFLGERRKGEVSYMDAATSWYDNIYFPLIQLIREQNILDQFPGRTETDLYLWILEKQSDIKAEYDFDVSIAEAAQALADDLKPDIGEESG